MMKMKKTISRGTVISRAHLADLLGIGANTVAKLDQDGVFSLSRATREDYEDAGGTNINANAKNFYWSKVAIEGYYKYNPLTEDSEVQLDASSRKLEAEAVIREVEAAIAIQEVANLEDITRITGNSLVLFREEMLSLISKGTALAHIRRGRRVQTHHRRRDEEQSFTEYYQIDLVISERRLGEEEEEE